MDERSLRIQGYKTLAGGALVQLFNGCFYLWANISVYVCSYLYHFDPTINQDAIFYVDTALVLLNVCGYQLGSYLLNTRKWNPKIIIAMGGTIALTGIFLSSFQKSLWMFIFFYGFFSGIGCGMMYMVPMVCGWDFFPARKGLVTGCVVGAYGLGSFIFTQVSYLVINPGNAEAEIKIKKDLKYFKWDVASRVPICLRIMVGIWVCQIIGGIILISRPTPEEREFIKSNAAKAQEDPKLVNQESIQEIEQEEEDRLDEALTQAESKKTHDLINARSALWSVRWWQYFWMLFLAQVFGGFFSYQYKQIGNASNISDKVLTWAGSMAAILQAVTRLTCGQLYDKYSFKKVFYPLMVINALNSVFAYPAREHASLFFISIELNYFVQAGIFSLFPTPAAKTFGYTFGP